MSDRYARSALGGAEAGGCLLRTATGFSVVDDDSFSLETHEIERSSTLLTAFESAEEGSHVPIRLTQSQLAQWRAYVRNTGQEVEASTGELQQILQAAEYLDDEATVTHASGALARVLFPASLPAAPPPGEDPAPLHRELSAAAAGVVGVLPEHLAIVTLRAALATVPQHAMLALLPEPLQPLALRAAHPTVDSSRALTLHDVESPAAAAVLRCAAANLSTHLTALSLNAVARWYKGRSLEDAAAALDAVAALLPQFEGLQHLEFRIGCPAHEANRICVLSVAAALPDLPHLTHLEICGMRAGSDGLWGLAQSLPALRMLCTLDLSRGVVVAHEPQWRPSVEALAAALRLLPALTRLSFAETCFRGNTLRDGRWEILAPAVATLPLQSLNLRNCGLGECFDLFSGCDTETRPFHDLQELDLSFNYCKDIRAGCFSRLPGLRWLDMRHVLPTPEAEEQLLQALLDNESADLEVLSLWQCNGKPAANAALCRGLTRWVRLHSLALSWRPQAYSAAVPELAPPLAALPQLRDLHLMYASVQSSADAPPALGQLRALTRLDLQYLRCSVRGAAALGSRIAALTCLCSLNIDLAIHATSERSSGAVLVRSLAALTRLTYLSLWDLHLDSDGAARLADAMQCMPCMHGLKIGFDKIRPGGAQALVAVLPMLSQLSMLILDTGVEQKEAEALAGVLPRMHALRRLILNVKTDAGKAAVLRAAPAGVQFIRV